MEFRIDLSLTDKQKAASEEIHFRQFGQMGIAGHRADKHVWSIGGKAASNTSVSLTFFGKVDRKKRENNRILDSGSRRQHAVHKVCTLLHTAHSLKAQTCNSSKLI